MTVLLIFWRKEGKSMVLAIRLLNKKLLEIEITASSKKQ